MCLFADVKGRKSKKGLKSAKNVNQLYLDLQNTRFRVRVNGLQHPDMGM